MGLIDHTSRPTLVNAGTTGGTRRITWTGSDLALVDVDTYRVRMPQVPRRVHAETSAPGEAMALVLGHHGEAVQGPVVHRKELRTAGITIPHPSRGAWAYARRIDEPALVMDPAKSKARGAVELALRQKRRDATHLRVDIYSNLAEGGGQGSSTADATAAVLAVFWLLDIPITSAEVCELVRQAEGAADPLALLDTGNAIVYYSRRGGLHLMLETPLPPAASLAFMASAEPVSTVRLLHETVYSRAEAARFRPVLNGAIRAIRRGDLHEFGRWSLQSLELNQERCPTPYLDELKRLMRAVDAAALTASHSGTVAALHWIPGIEGLARRKKLTSDALRVLGAVDIHEFPSPLSLQV